MLSSVSMRRDQVPAEGIEQGIIVMSIPALLGRNPNISNEDIASIIRSNLPIECYKTARVRVRMESYKFSTSREAVSARAIRIRPFGDFESFFREIAIFFVGVKYSNHPYSTTTMTKHALGIGEIEVGKEHWLKLFEEKREIVIHVTKDEFYFEFASEAEIKGICLIL